MMRRRPTLIFIAILALAQAALAAFRALQWFDVGADLLGKGIILLPFLGVIAFARGALVIVLAMLYLLFTAGMLLEKNWAWWLGLIVCAINVLLVVNVVIQGESVLRAAFWSIAPIIIAVYLLSRSGRAAATLQTEMNS